MIIKKQLGERLVDMYYPDGSGKQACEEFERVFSKKQLPDEIPVMSSDDLAKLELDPQKLYLVHLMTKTELSKSNSDARKLIKAGAVTINEEKITDPDYEFCLQKEMILKVGKRRFLRLEL